MAIAVQCHSLSLERSMLNTILRKGAIMLEEANNVLKGDGTHFFIPEHQTIYNALCSLYDNKRNIDIIILNEHLKLTKQFNPEITTTLQRISTSKVIDDFKSSLQILLDYSLRRRIGNTALKVAADCMVDGTDVQQIALELSDVNTIFGIGENMNTEEISSIAERALQALEVRIDNKRNNIKPGVQTGITDIDNKITGLMGNMLIVLAGRPGTGKTALALTIANNVAANKTPVLVFSLEMDKAQLMDRVISYRLKIDANDIKNGSLTEYEMEYIRNNIVETTNVPLIIDDNANVDLFDIRNTIRKHIKDNGIKLVIIDYLQLIKPPQAQSREREVSMITRQLKLYAKEFNIPILVLAQLNRSSETQGREPELSDLRESGSIEQDADMVWFLSQYNIPLPSHAPNDCVRFTIAKFRNGTTDKIPLRFIKKYVSYFNYDYVDNEIRIVPSLNPIEIEDNYFIQDDEDEPPNNTLNGLEYNTIVYDNPF